MIDEQKLYDKYVAYCESIGAKPMKKEPWAKHNHYSIREKSGPVSQEAPFGGSKS